MRAFSKQILSAAVLSVLAAAPLLATDGVIEINQAKAMAGGVTPGDTQPGYPVVLSVPGSYKLTSNLDDSGGMPAFNVVEIQSGDVSLDLNGFEIIGPAGMGGGSCIYSGMSNRVRISNGTVRACPWNGIDANNGTVDRVIVSNTGNYGILVNLGRISNAHVTVTGAAAIYVAQGGAVSNSLSQSGGPLGGIWVVAGVIEGSVAMSGTGPGLRMGSGVIRSSYSASNTGAEIDCLASCAIEANMLDSCGMSGCIAGAALQTPPASNKCEGVVCP